MSFFASTLTRFAFLLAGMLCSAASQASEAADPPGRVGRLGEMTGQVWLYTPDAGEWVAAVRNRPLTTGDRLSTDADARAELRVGSTTVRLDAGTELEVLRLDDDQVSLQLHNGSVAVRLRYAEAAREFELRTPEGRFLTHRAGRYRFDRADDASHVTVHNGEALYEGPGSALTVNAGQRAEFWMEGRAAQYSITEPVRDAFASWSAERDRADERSASARYVSPEMTGAEDLDRHGRWESSTEYGTVWIPRHVPHGWVPYSAGHWAWISPWGWTWVDDAPWGFAPFHYGRWVVVNHRWCWAPGHYVRRPVYAPALVGWVDTGRLGLSVQVGRHHGPSVGWFPLAPREVYVPTYRVTPRYVQQVNITHVTNITNVTTIVRNPNQVVRGTDYRNFRHPHAVTVVPRTVLENRQPVAPVAAQWRHEGSRHWHGERVRDAAVVAPQVEPPRRRLVAVTSPLAPQAGPAVAIPPAPGRVQRAAPEAEPRSFTHDRPRRHEAHEAPRLAAPGQAVTPQPQPQPAIQPAIQPAAPVVRERREHRVPSPHWQPQQQVHPQPQVRAPVQEHRVAVPQPQARPMPAVPQVAPAPAPVAMPAPPPRPVVIAPPPPQPAPPAAQRHENRNPNRDDVPGRGGSREMNR